MIELLSIITSLEHLPPRDEQDPERLAERAAREGSRQAAARRSRAPQRGRRGLHRPRTCGSSTAIPACRELRPARRAARRAGVPPRLLARRLGGDQLPALLRHQRARRRPHGGSGGVRRGAPLRVPAAAGAAPSPGCASITSTGCTIRGDYLRRLQARARELGVGRRRSAAVPRRREDPRARRAAARRLAGRRHDRLRVRRRGERPLRAAGERAGVRRHLHAVHGRPRRRSTSSPTRRRS